MTWDKSWILVENQCKCNHLATFNSSPQRLRVCFSFRYVAASRLKYIWDMRWTSTYRQRLVSYVLRLTKWEGNIRVNFKISDRTLFLIKSKIFKKRRWWRAKNLKGCYWYNIEGFHKKSAGLQIFSFVWKIEKKL